MVNSPEYGGGLLKEMVKAATSWLEKATPQIDAINVFPVPDGDTGTNMLFTMRSAEKEALSANDHAGRVLQAIATGALMGGRGNSGVILAQIWRGLAQALQEKATFTTQDLACAFKQAATLAYKGISQPQEGTMLTVIREVAEALNDPNTNFSDLVSLMEVAIAKAKEAVAKTPSLLPILAEAGVVDAGGQGLYTIFEGVLLYLKKEKITQPFILAPKIEVMLPQMDTVAQEEAYGYCTEFVICGAKIKPEEFGRQLEKLGKSVMVAGDDTAIKVHIHTFDPGGVLHQAIKWGSLHNILIRNMDEQVKNFKESQIAVSIALVVVANGQGFMELFRSLGVFEIIPGGDKMNPSVGKLLEAVNSVQAKQIIFLPNNKNIIPAANQVKELSYKKITIIPSTSLPQGVAAAVAFNPEASLSDNLRLMEKALSSTKTLSITKATREASLGEVKIKKGQFIGLIDGELIAAHEEILGLVLQILKMLDFNQIETITIYYGIEISRKQADEIAKIFRENTPAEVEVLFGGQALYHYLISLE